MTAAGSSRPPRRMSRWSVRLRSATGAAPLLLLRRARRDGALLLLWIGTVAAACVLAAIGPAHLAATVDAGAREAVADVGEDGDVVLEVPVGDAAEAQGSLRNELQGSVPPDDVVAFAEEAGERLPPAMAATFDPPTVAAVGAGVAIRSVTVAPALDTSVALRLTVGLLTPDGLDALRVVDGVLPDDDADDAVEVAIAEEAATASGLAVGSVIPLPASASTSALETLPIRVTALVAQREEDRGGGSAWRDAAEAVRPTVLLDRRTTRVGVTALATPRGATRVVEARGSAFAGTIRFSPRASRFDADALAAVTADAARLRANASELAGTRFDSDVATAFVEAESVAGFPARARATSAELSVLVAGVVGVGAAVLVLVSHLLVRRRLADLRLERARGASTVSVALVALLEGCLAAGVAVLLALAALDRLAPGGPASWGAEGRDLVGLVVAVAVISIVAPSAAGAVDGEGAARRARANGGSGRRGALRRARLRALTRLAVEGAVLAVTALSVLALLDRGLLQTGSRGIDPLLSAAPLLVAAAVVVLVLRGYGIAVRVVSAVVRRERGIAGPILAARALRGVAPVPLAALTLAVSLVVGSAILGQTVRDGQVDASWEVVGADARSTGRVDRGELDAVTSAAGVSAASVLGVRPNLRLDLGTGDAGATLVATDAGYAGLLRRLPSVAGVRDDAVADRMARLGAAPVGDAVPVVVDERLADRIVDDRPVLAIGDERVPLEVLGVVPAGSTGFVTAPAVYADREALSSRISQPVVGTVLLATGPGAATAVAALASDDAEILTRPGWLEERRGLALLAGVDTAAVVAAAALALLALLAVICAALAGAPERARDLALLRTLGVRPRFGVLLAAVDQVPLLIASLVGGLVAGLGIGVVLGPALGLRFLTGGEADPPIVVPPGPLLLVTLGLAVVVTLGTTAEVLLRRRDRVSDTLRVGGAA